MNKRKGPIPKGVVSKKDLRQIDLLVEHYKNNRELFGRFSENVRALFSSDRLGPYVHSRIWRIKTPERLKDKLLRKLMDSRLEKKTFDITEDNLFERITDLVGFRILHLHTTQFESINKIVTDLLNEERWVLIEGPTARTWDDEYREYYQKIKIETRESERMYTSVHYTFKPNKQKNCTGELQVRTLAEELWGEVDHKINYPHPADSSSCREQIKVLARLTSSCTRLVDSIFHTYQVDNLSPKTKVSK
jgi:putative GTP pyrophosphokinase